MPSPNAPAITEILRRRLIFVGGKGGVGKTAVSQAIALALSRQGKRTLWVEFENPSSPPGELRMAGSRLWHLNCEAGTAFEEYIGMKIGGGALTRMFLNNKLIQYLSKAAPGIHELVLLGKVWHERQNYDHVVADMPSTGYMLAMFQSADNFSRLFKGGPIHRDAEAMTSTFADPAQSGHLIVALPEEMPLQEGLELDEMLRKMYPRNPAAFLVNRRFPAVATLAGDIPASPDDWQSPVPASALDYARKRGLLEKFNLGSWEGIPYGELPYRMPAVEGASRQPVIAQLADDLVSREMLAS